jgi:hypothetical protein
MQQFGVMLSAYGFVVRDPIKERSPAAGSRTDMKVPSQSDFERERSGIGLMTFFRSTPSEPRRQL